MNANIQALVVACKQAGIHYESLHRDGNVIIVHAGRRPALFVNWATPINSHAIAHLCRDKDYLYTALSSYVTMPKTCSFLDPQVKEKYENYFKYATYAEITEQVEKNFDYPFILKRNRGTHGSNIFRIEDRTSLHAKLAQIFDKTSRAYDYVALAQTLIDIKTEFRAVYFKGSIVFAYLKDVSGADYTGNLSPLHWDGAKAVQVTDSRFLDELERFAAPGLKKIGIDYAGLDIALDQEGRLSLIEVNSAPGFDIYVEDCGQEAVIGLFSLILEDLK